MPISFGQIGTLIKTAATGVMQTILPKKDDAASSKAVSREPENTPESNAYFTDTVVVRPSSRPAESTPQHRELESLSDRGGAFQEMGQSASGTAFENQTPQVQQMLQTWLQMDPKAIEGLRNFIEVEFQHSPENAETFLKFQVVRMLQDARQLIEQNELAAAAKGTVDVEAEAQRAIIGASSLGFAYFKKLRKRAKISLRGAAAKLLSPEEQEARFESGMQAAAHFLRQAEKELRKAIEGSDEPGPLQKLLAQVNDAYQSLEFLLTRKSLMKKIPA